MLIKIWMLLQILILVQIRILIKIRILIPVRMLIQKNDQESNLKKIPTVRYHYGSVADLDPGGSGFKLSGLIRIRIRNPDQDPVPGSEIEL